MIDSTAANAASPPLQPLRSTGRAEHLEGQKGAATCERSMPRQGTNPLPPPETPGPPPPSPLPLTQGTMSYMPLYAPTIGHQQAAMAFASRRRA
ncbi:hypothetical protein VDGL01_03466 [Verticillium dahliae]